MRYRWAWEGQSLRDFICRKVCIEGVFREGEGAWSGKKNGVWWQLIFPPPAVASIRDVGYLVISVMALSPFVTASVEWYNWARGHIFCCLLSNDRKREAILNKCCLPFSMQCNLFPSGGLVGTVVVFKCLALSVQTVFLTCLLRSVWQCPVLNEAQNLRMASLHPSLFSLLPGAGGNGQNPSQRPSMGWHLKDGKA